MNTHDGDAFEHSTMGPTEAMVDASEAICVHKVCSACGEVGHCSYDCSSHEGEAKGVRS